MVEPRESASQLSLTELNIAFTLPKEESNPVKESQEKVSSCSQELRVENVDNDQANENKQSVVSVLDQSSYTIESTSWRHAKSRDEESGELSQFPSASKDRLVETFSPKLGSGESSPILENSDDGQVKKISPAIIRLSEPVSALSSGSNTSANSVYYDTVAITPERIVEKESRKYAGGSVSRESVASIYYDTFESPVHEDSSGDLFCEGSSCNGYAESASEETVIECPYGVLQTSSTFDSEDNVNDLKIKAHYIVERAIDNARLVLFQCRVRDPVNISNSDITFDRTLTPVDKSASDVGHLKGASPFPEQVCAEGESTRYNPGSVKPFDLISDVEPDLDNYAQLENRNNNCNELENKDHSGFFEDINNSGVIPDCFENLNSCNNEKGFVHDISAGEAPQELNISFEEGYSREFLEEYLEEDSHFSEDESPETIRAVFDVILEGRHSSLGEFKQVGAQNTAQPDLAPDDLCFEDTSDSYRAYLDASCHQFREELEDQASADVYPDSFRSSGIESYEDDIACHKSNCDIPFKVVDRGTISLFEPIENPENCSEIDKGATGEKEGEFLTLVSTVNQEEDMAHSSYVAGQRKVCQFKSLFDTTTCVYDFLMSLHFGHFH